MRGGYNGIKLADMPEDAHVTITVQSDKYPSACGVYSFRMIKGSPIRQLLEMQEIYEEGFEQGELWRGDVESL